MPGFDRSRIVGLTEQDLDEFTCSICLAIFINPTVTYCCRQTYCKDCIREWVSQHKTCPNDRKTLTLEGLSAVPRLVINLLDNMKVKCKYEFDGCSQVFRMGNFYQHLTICEYRPNQLCKTCGLMRGCVSTHNCIQSLIIDKDETKEKYFNLFEESSHLLSEKLKNEGIISTLRNELAQMKINQQLIVDKLKSEHKETVDELKDSYARALEKQRENLENKINNLKQTYSKQKQVVSDLEYQLSNYKSKLLLSETNCGILTDQLKSEHTKAVEEKREFEVINEKLYKELGQLRKYQQLIVDCWPLIHSRANDLYQ